jgi:hypothetical protein
MRRNYLSGKAGAWLFGLLVGVALASVLTVFISVREWFDNPGGIFRDENGTNWSFVFETATSWFVPTFLYTAVIATILRFAWTVLSRSR